MDKVTLVCAWILAALFSLYLIATTNACASKPVLGPQEGAELTDYAAKLMKCETEARNADSFKAFDACARDAGLK